MVRRTRRSTPDRLLGLLGLVLGDGLEQEPGDDRDAEVAHEGTVHAGPVSGVDLLGEDRQGDGRADGEADEEPEDDALARRLRLGGLRRGRGKGRRGGVRRTTP
jgi:hypothetical protein